MQHRAAGSALPTGMGRTMKNHHLPPLDKLLPRKQCSTKPSSLAPAKANMGRVGIPVPDLSCLDLESELQCLCGLG